MRYLRRVALPGLAVVVACAVVAGLVSGRDAALSALGGGLAVAVLLGSTPAVLGPVATVMPALSLAAAVSFYLTKVAVMAAALVVLVRADDLGGLDVRALGIAVIVTTLAWTLLLVVAALRSRQLAYDLPVTTTTPPDSLGGQ